MSDIPWAKYPDSFSKALSFKEKSFAIHLCGIIIRLNADFW